VNRLPTGKYIIDGLWCQIKKILGWHRRGSGNRSGWIQKRKKKMDSCLPGMTEKIRRPVGPGKAIS
jgi:hypothetical protein